MFIEITNPSNPLRIENFLRPYKRGERPFTPEVAREILTMTNHPRNIKDTLQLIAAQPNQADYKEIVLSVFDHREQPADITILGKKLALANGFETELKSAINHDYTEDTTNGFIYASASNQIATYICAEEIPDLTQYPDNIALYCTNTEVCLSDTYLSRIKSLKFKEGAKVDLSECKNLPTDLDVSMCDKVSLYGSDLSQVKSLKFKKGSTIDLSKCQNLPAELDVSMCDKIDLSFTNISSVKSLKFKNKQQQEKSELKIPKDWHGTIQYTDTTLIMHKLKSLFSR